MNKPERAFIDTNLLLRYLTNDVPEQADAVQVLLERAARKELILVTNAMVIAELVWMLSSFYKLSRVAVQEKVLGILHTPGLEVVEANLLIQAIDDYVEKNVGFIDAYGAAWLVAQGMKVVYTFDRRHFSRLAEVQVVVPQPAG